ncbi:LysR family transcriptional regulator [Achromobacter arsenitoxydans SY8]|uniref:LysR family transcriptional regulator n=2 Tax=Achromobacter TaxID=222 RepID=H0F8P2_9BURK|nr:LysR family transcriptional regulator [Achromobacter arsenitoxydans SY8]
MIALDEERNLGRAASRLHMSQPAASKALTQLEEQVGYVLFERTSQGTRPTAAGTVMILHARHTLGSAVRVAEELQAAQERGTTLLRLGTLPSAAVTVAPSLIAALCQRMPALEVTLVEGVLDNLLDRLSVDELDIVLGRLGGRPLPAECEAMHLHDEPICIVSAPGHALASLRGQQLRDLRGRSWILPLPGTMLRERLERAFEQAGLPVPPARIHTNSLLATLAHIGQSDSLAVMPTAIAGFYRDRGSLDVLPVRIDANFGAIGAIYRQQGARMPAVQAALDWLGQAREPEVR